MNKLLFSLTVLLAMTSCSKGNKKAAAQPSPSVSNIAQTSLISASKWREDVYKDPMSDDISYTLTRDDMSGEGSITLRCDPNGANSIFFRSREYLDSGHMGQIQYRIDNEPARTVSAFLTGREALLASPLDDPDPRKQNEALAAKELFHRLRDEDHRQLRVRVSSYGDATDDLDFDLSGLKEKIWHLSGCPPTIPNANE